MLAGRTTNRPAAYLRPAAAARASGAGMHDPGSDVRKRYVDEMKRELAPIVGSGPAAARIPDLARRFVDGVSSQGVDLSAINDPMGHRMVLTMDAGCWDVLRRLQNELAGAHAGAPLAAVALSRKASNLFRDNANEGQTQRLLDNLEKMGVQQLTFPVQASQPLQLLKVSAIPSLRTIDIQPDEGAMHWRAYVRPGVAVTCNGEITDPACMEVREGTLIVRQQPANLPPPVNADRAHAAVRHRHQTRLAVALGALLTDPPLDAPTLTGLARALLSGVGEKGADFSVFSEPGKPFGVPGPLSSAVLMLMNSECWDVLVRCKQEMTGSGLDALVLPPGVTRHFVEGRQAFKLENLIAQMDGIGIRKITVKVGNESDGDFNFRALDRVRSLAEIEVTCPHMEGDWMLEVPRGVKVAVTPDPDGRPAPRNWVRFWDKFPVAWVRLNLAENGGVRNDGLMDPTLLLSPGLAKALQPPPREVVDRLRQQLDSALALHESWGLIGAGERGAKAQRLLAWAGAGHLDFRNPPGELADIVQFVTPGILTVLQSYAAELREGGIGKITLSPGMSRSFVVRRDVGSASGRPPPYAWLPGALRLLPGLRDVVVELPDDVPAGGQANPTDFWSLNLDTPEQLFIHLKCPPVQGAWDVHVRAGVMMLVISDQRSVGQEVRIHPWNGLRPQQPISFQVPSYGTAESAEFSDSGAIADLVMALHWHLNWEIGVRPAEAHFKARRLLEWAGPTLDFRNPPEDIRGILELMTPELLDALQKAVAALHEHGVREIILSPSMSLALATEKQNDGTQGPGPLNWLARSLGQMPGLTHLRLDLPLEARRGVDLPGLTLRGPGQLPVQFEFAPVPAPVSDVHAPSGTHVSSSSSDLRPFDGSDPPPLAVHVAERKGEASSESKG